MATLLLRHAALVLTMDAERREITDGAVAITDGFITDVGPTADVEARLGGPADRTVDLHGHLLAPGLVNTHHHFTQSLTRAVPAAQDVPLFEWLRALYPIWARLTPEHFTVSTQLALAELALSGCTTAFDHTYLFPPGCSLDHQIEAAAEVGPRFHASRGSMSLGESAGGLPPDEVVEDEDAILEDCERVIGRYHDPAPGSFLQIALAPCSPFSVTPRLMTETAALARRHGVRLHTHLAETDDENAYCLEHVGTRPVDWMEELGWLGDDVWYAHAVFIDDDEIRRFGAGGVGIAHCPTSNMRLASGIPPVRDYLAAGIPVGLGVDGSASNDSGDLLAEARNAMLLARLDAAPNQRGGPLLAARAAWELATRGGAAVLGRDDIGSLEVGKAGDAIAIDLERVEYAGALHDPVAAVMLCAPVTVDYSWVHGESIVVDGDLITLDMDGLIEEHNDAARALLDG